jgi:hypothetical protein
MAEQSPSPPTASHTETPPAPQPRRRPRRPRAPGAYLRLPVWQRFVLAGVIAVVLLVAMVIFVEHNNTNTNRSLNEAAEVKANRDAVILVRQDQAPHSMRLQAHQRPTLALERAIHGRMAAQIATGVIDGPLRAARCRASGAPRDGRSAFSCTIIAGQVTYPFLGVVDTASRQITYCKRDPPPTPSDNVPVSIRCRR